jgi:hypothetical protein
MTQLDSSHVAVRPASASTDWLPGSPCRGHSLGRSRGRGVGGTFDHDDVDDDQNLTGVQRDATVVRDLVGTTDGRTRRRGILRGGRKRERTCMSTSRLSVVALLYERRTFTHLRLLPRECHVPFAIAARDHRDTPSQCLFRNRQRTLHEGGALRVVVLLRAHAQYRPRAVGRSFQRDQHSAIRLLRRTVAKSGPASRGLDLRHVTVATW